MIVDHEHPNYHANQYAGAYHYAKEIKRNIIPNVETDRNWILLNVRGFAADHSIVFIHNNLHPSNYDWLRDYNDLILVCGVPETCEKVAHLGTAIYLPISIDVAEVAQYKRPKTKGAAFVGRVVKRQGITFPPETDFLEGMRRADLLKAMAEYSQLYAVGRCALEGIALGCEILAYDPRFPDASRWELLDNKDAAKILQSLLDEIDERGNGENEKTKSKNEDSRISV